MDELERLHRHLVAVALSAGPSILLIQAFSACQRITSLRASFMQDDRARCDGRSTPFAMLRYQCQSVVVLRVAALQHDVACTCASPSSLRTVSCMSVPSR